MGKSVLTRAIIRTLKAKFSSSGGDAVAVTATTGVAATNIGGRTLHSWSGAGLAKAPMDKLVGQIVKGGKGEAGKRWKACKALIIDEGKARTGLPW